jgi:hypothetical protein
VSDTRADPSYEANSAALLGDQALASADKTGAARPQPSMPGIFSPRRTLGTCNEGRRRSRTAELWSDSRCGYRTVRPRRTALAPLRCASLSPRLGRTLCGHMQDNRHT